MFVLSNLSFFDVTSFILNARYFLQCCSLLQASENFLLIHNLILVARGFKNDARSQQIILKFVFGHLIQTYSSKTK